MAKPDSQILPPKVPTKDDGVSFCIITDGSRPLQLRNEVESIIALNIPEFEILIGGKPALDLVHPAIQSVPMIELAHEGRLGALRNGLCRRARFDLLVVADDDLRFEPDFYTGLQAFPGDYDVLCVRFLNPDGSRYWDWAAHRGKLEHVLLDYDATDDHVYVTGGLCIMKASVLRTVQWDETLRIGQGEDVDFSRRLHAAGLRIAFNHRCTVIHDDPRNTQVGNVVARVLHETAGVELIQFFGDGGDRWWLGQTGTIRVPGGSTPAHLTFELQCERQELYPDFPLTLHLYVNECRRDPILFQQDNERRIVRVTLPNRLETRVRLEPDRFFVPRERGLNFDPRPFAAWLQGVAVIPTSSPPPSPEFTVEQHYPDAEPLEDGFYPPERDGRWMSSCGSLTIPPAKLPGSVALRLSCSRAEHYAQFPFAVNFSVDGAPLRAVVFETGEQTLIARLTLKRSDKERVIKLESKQSFVPRFRGISLDARRLSILLGIASVTTTHDEAKGDRLEVEFPVYGA
jgi:hypothetical protein